MQKGGTMMEIENRKPDLSKNSYRSRGECLAILDEIRWASGFYCPVCGDSGCYPIRSRGLLECRTCNKQISATSGTVLHGARNLDIWLRVIEAFASDTSLTAAALARELRARYETVWQILQKLRASILQEASTSKLPRSIRKKDLLKALFKWSKENKHPGAKLEKTNGVASKAAAPSEEDRISTIEIDTKKQDAELAKSLTNYLLLIYFGVSKKYSQLYIAEHWLRQSIIRESKPNTERSNFSKRRLLSFFLRAGPGRMRANEINEYSSPELLIYPRESVSVFRSL